MPRMEGCRQTMVFVDPGSQVPTTGGSLMLGLLSRVEFRALVGEIGEECVVTAEVW